jgi:hypothetical protein
MLGRVDLILARIKLILLTFYLKLDDSLKTPRIFIN